MGERTDETWALSFGVLTRVLTDCHLFIIKLKAYQTEDMLKNKDWAITLIEEIMETNR